MTLQVLDTGIATAGENMSRDAQLLRDLTLSSPPILHLYDWQSSAFTYGHFVNPTDYLCPEGIKKWGFDHARRPTGGGILLHTCDLAFSLLVPASHPSFSLNTLANYAYINHIVLRAIKRFRQDRGPMSLLAEAPKPSDSSSQKFCMAHPTRYDIMLEGRKVGGAAQRRTRDGLLHQASICLTLPPQDCLSDLLLPGNLVAEGMRNSSFPLLGDESSNSQIAEARHELRHLLVESFEEVL